MDDKKFREVFMGEGLEPLTDKLIKELVKDQGMSKKDLRYFKKQGYSYSRPRGTMISPLEFC